MSNTIIGLSEIYDMKWVSAPRRETMKPRSTCPADPPVPPWGHSALCPASISSSTPPPSSRPHCEPLLGLFSRGGSFTKLLVWKPNKLQAPPDLKRSSLTINSKWKIPSSGDLCQVKKGLIVLTFSHEIGCALVLWKTKDSNGNLSIFGFGMCFKCGAPSKGDIFPACIQLNHYRDQWGS